MVKKKIIVTLPSEQVAAIHSFVASRGAKSVSAFIQYAIMISLNDQEQALHQAFMIS